MEQRLVITVQIVFGCICREWQWVQYGVVMVLLWLFTRIYHLGFMVPSAQVQIMDAFVYMLPYISRSWYKTSNIL